MNLYEILLEEVSEELIVDDKAVLPQTIKGFYVRENDTNVILLNKHIDTLAEKTCTFVEEVGHHYTTVGDITDQSRIENRKQELKARRWAVKRLIRVEEFIEAHNAGISTRYDLADFLNVTEEFVDMAIEHFKSIYGQYHDTGDHIVFFEPLGVLRKLY